MISHIWTLWCIAKKWFCYTCVLVIVIKFNNYDSGCDRLWYFKIWKYLSNKTLCKTPFHLNKMFGAKYILQFHGKCYQHHYNWATCLVKCLIFLSIITLVSLHPRINLSPFTKDFRGEEHYNESIDLFFCLHFAGAIFQTKWHEFTIRLPVTLYTNVVPQVGLFVKIYGILDKNQDELGQYCYYSKVLHQIYSWLIII